MSISIPSLVITLLLVLGFLAAVLAALRHFRGEGGCCGGGGAMPPPAANDSSAPVVAKRRLVIDGMSCMHCVAHVTQALNALDGVSAEVHLTPPAAIVTLERQVSDEALRKAVSDAGFQVTAIEEIPLKQ